jgi:hypothetical protein
MEQQLAASSFAEGMTIPVGDQRYPSSNIRLSAAMCAIGFPIKHEEPCTRTIEAGDRGPREIVTFWHEPRLADGDKTHPTCPKLAAVDVDAWWRYPGKFTVSGYDDALLAMRRVLECRQWLIEIVHGARRIQNQHFSRSSVVTDELHYASVLKACGFELLAAERRGRKFLFVFGSKAARVIELLVRSESPESVYPDRRPEGEKSEPDLCVDWMLWALKYRDWLHRIVNSPDCVPMIEMRDGERVLRISSNMPDKLKKEWVSYL